MLIMNWDKMIYTSTINAASWIAKISQNSSWIFFKIFTVLILAVVHNMTELQTKLIKSTKRHKHKFCKNPSRSVTARWCQIVRLMLPKNSAFGPNHPIKKHMIYVNGITVSIRSEITSPFRYSCTMGRKEPNFKFS